MRALTGWCRGTRGVNCQMLMSDNSGRIVISNELSFFDRVVNVWNALQPTVTVKFSRLSTFRTFVSSVVKVDIFPIFLSVILNNYQLCYCHAILCFGQLSVFFLYLPAQLYSVGLHVYMFVCSS